jgi:hypothetical protein
MSSYHGADTAKIQNDMRRQAKKKQSRGTGTGKHNEREPIDFKEAMRNVPRHFDGFIESSLVNDCLFWTQQNNRIITNGLFRRWFLSHMRLDESDTKDKDLVVVLDGENAKILNAVGLKIKITSDGFVPLSDKAPIIWSITFRFSKSDLVGFQAKWDDVRKQMFIY